MKAAQIIVTGASRGIGAAIAEVLAQRGFEVVGLSRSGDTAAGRGLACDMTDEAAVRETFAGVAASGPVAGLVNNAGIHLGSPSSELQTAEYEKVMRVNATAVMVAAREIHPYLKAAGGGTIVNIGSFFDKLGVSGTLAYCASKAAVGAITRCLAVEWAGDGIRVLNVAPGYVETDLNREFLQNEKVRRFMQGRIPAGGPGKPADVAALVGTLFGEQSVFFTGETIYIDGGHGINV
jgi:NAD(P)-dependent dehydrogenase (short-subunit alcohol dehydrogenase family)